MITQVDIEIETFIDGRRMPFERYVMELAPVATLNTVRFAGLAGDFIWSSGAHFRDVHSFTTRMPIGAPTRVIIDGEIVERQEYNSFTPTGGPYWRPWTLPQSAQAIAEGLVLGDVRAWTTDEAGVTVENAVVAGEVSSDVVGPRADSITPTAQARVRVDVDGTTARVVITNIGVVAFTAQVFDGDVVRFTSPEITPSGLWASEQWDMGAAGDDVLVRTTAGLVLFDQFVASTDED